MSVSFSPIRKPNEVLKNGAAWPEFNISNASAAHLLSALGYELDSEGEWSMAHYDAIDLCERLARCVRTFTTPGWAHEFTTSDVRKHEENGALFIEFGIDEERFYRHLRGVSTIALAALAMGRDVQTY